ncbi:tetratricopeptide repeat protein [Paenibacillus cisolokensis]|uniref:tetratricopeptide repeat protein n=1 Tax=Paenibacillus cisolokensis TaxID=1658519 RepID=UPI001BD03ACA|nr:tetratricopeptide repeat protein [Paenibacillus cisolokensis]
MLKRLLTTLLVLALITGCTDSKLYKESISSGDQYIKEGKYKEAIDSYKTALSEKENSKETQRKLELAQKSMTYTCF